MDIEIVPDDHVTRLEGWSELGSHIGVELVAVHRAIDDEGRGDGIAAQPGDEGLSIPFAEGSLGMKALAPPAPAAQRRHIRLERVRRENDSLDRFLVHLTIDEDEATGALVHGGLAMVAPFIPLTADVGACAFRRHQRFF